VADDEPDQDGSLLPLGVVLPRARQPDLARFFCRGLHVMDDERPVVIVCRDIPGEHIGGRGCWCCPYVLSTDEEIVRYKNEVADRPERQVN
jgi:hypothetical protein